MYEGGFDVREQNILTPTGVSQYIKSLMDRDRLLSNVMVGGELSNYKKYPSGHHYFSLKDSEGAIRCVIFRGDVGGIQFQPQNGMKVIATGRVTVFPRDGQYQLYCTRLVLDGVGDLHVAFEQCKEKLYKQGYFDPNHKQPLPRYPKKIALITSPAGAAVRDMIRVLGARFPLAEVCVLPVHVQGEGAAQEIAAAIGWANYYQVADLIIAGRGGGSMEDLWAFNEEILAAAIYQSNIPIISAVGHEPDVTIADFVADLRAATPSNGAELAVPDWRELQSWLSGAESYMLRQLTNQLERHKTALTRLENSRVMTNPQSYFGDKRMLLDFQQNRLTQGLSNSMNQQKHRLGNLAGKLDALSPLKVLGRGYAIPRLPDGQVLASTKQASPGDKFNLTVSDGEISCRVES